MGKNGSGAAAGELNLRRCEEEDGVVGQSIQAMSLLVRDYDEAIAFFTGCLRFALVEDTPLGDGKRWVLVAPPANKGAALLLARAASAEQESRIGNQTGGRVSLFLHTDDFWRDYEEMKSRGVRFAEEPRQEVYGTVVVFLDLYGNKWDLVLSTAER
jgi:catechol 2,3-dioxygenase-like lactoylglutathione lyase family enzyme